MCFGEAAVVSALWVSAAPPTPVPAPGGVNLMPPPTMLLFPPLPLWGEALYGEVDTGFSVCGGGEAAAIPAVPAPSLGAGLPADGGVNLMPLLMLALLRDEKDELLELEVPTAPVPAPPRGLYREAIDVERSPDPRSGRTHGALFATWCDWLRECELVEAVETSAPDLYPPLDPAGLRYGFAFVDAFPYLGTGGFK